MNTATITGTIATTPRYRRRGLVPATTFDIHVDIDRRAHTFHVRAMNDLARQSRYLRIDALVTITGYLHADPYDMPDNSVWHRVEIVAHQVDQQPPPARRNSDELAGRGATGIVSVESTVHHAR